MPLGHGGMGEVLVAYDERIGREVALKRMLEAEPCSDDLTRFVREAKVQGRLDHPAVVPVYDLANDDEGRPYFVMKRLRGKSLSFLLLKPTEDIAGLRRRLWRAFVDVCMAIEFAHQKSVIHRDLKPANIMLGDFGEAYVLDWGVARTIAVEGQTHPLAGGANADEEIDGEETLVGTVLGTPGYMAPEQVSGERVGPAADIYALGCILYEISTGQRLHPNAAKGEVAGIFLGVDARPSRVEPDSPPELDAICQRATAVEPAHRFASARDLADAVQRFLDGERDVNVRSALAAEHVVEARTALESGVGGHARREAMRAAGRALALDPASRDAADLVAQLVLTPPRETPPEVTTRLAALDDEHARTQGRRQAWSLLMYCLFIPVMFWTGVRSWPVVAALAPLAVLTAGHIWWITRTPGLTSSSLYLNVAFNALLIAFVVRVSSPFFFAPTLVAITLMAYMAHPRFGRAPVVAALLSSGVLVPWLLEELGVLSPTYRFVNGGMELHSPVVYFSALPMHVASVAALVAASVVIIALSRNIAARQRHAAERLETAAWQIRDLVPGLPQPQVGRPAEKTTQRSV
ncbi:MAG: serine/threonine protein kinase [Kofleriaceae bacterium]|nr:serine/threonine protein kinase [Kofleriaceae bacterium]